MSKPLTVCLNTEKLTFSENNAIAQDVLAEAGQKMRQQFSIYECTIQIEKYTDKMDTCEECKGPQK